MAKRQVPAVPTTDWLRPLPPAVRFMFHGNAAARAAALAVWEVGFSDEALRARHDSTRASLWMGPDEYLLLDGGAEDAGAATFLALEAALARTPHALVDISHRQFAFEVRGPHAEAILAGACPLDLELSRFPLDMCTRTVLAKADIVLWRTGSECFRVEAWRSFAGYVTGILGEIAREFPPSG
jgi:sarcosine oxidase subunit gamma